MFGGDGYSTRTATVTASVRNLIRAPEGDWAKFQTEGGNFSLRRQEAVQLAAVLGQPGKAVDLQLRALWRKPTEIGLR